MYSRRIGTNVSPNYTNQQLKEALFGTELNTLNKLNKINNQNIKKLIDNKFKMFKNIELNQKQINDLRNILKERLNKLKNENNIIEA